MPTLLSFQPKDCRELYFLTFTPAWLLNGVPFQLDHDS
jgi:hypothetical protein